MNRRLLVIVAICLAVLAVPAGASAQSAGSRFPTVLLSGKTAQGRFQGGAVDPPLNADGEWAAAELAGSLNPARWSAVYSSTMRFVLNCAPSRAIDPRISPSQRARSS